MTGLGVYRIPRNEGNHLPPLFFNHMFALFGGKMYLPFLDNATGNSCKIRRMKHLFQ